MISFRVAFDVLSRFCGLSLISWSVTYESIDVSMWICHNSTSPRRNKTITNTRTRLYWPHILLPESFNSLVVAWSAPKVGTNLDMLDTFLSTLNYLNHSQTLYRFSTTGIHPYINSQFYSTCASFSARLNPFFICGIWYQWFVNMYI